MRDRSEFQWWGTDRSVYCRNFSTEYAVNDTGFGESSRLVRFPPPLAHCEPETRLPRGAFFFMCQRGLKGPSALRRLANRARSVSERPPSLSTRPSLWVRRIQNPHRFQQTDGVALRPCFAGSGLSQSRWRRDTRGGAGRTIAHPCEVHGSHGGQPT